MFYDYLTILFIGALTLLLLVYGLCVKSKAVSFIALGLILLEGLMALAMSQAGQIVARI